MILLSVCPSRDISRVKSVKDILMKLYLNSEYLDPPTYWYNIFFPIIFMAAGYCCIMTC